MFSKRLFSNRNIADFIIFTVSIIVLYSCSFFLDFIDGESWLDSVYTKIYLIYACVITLIFQVLELMFRCIYINNVLLDTICKYSILTLTVVKIISYVVMLIMYATYITKLLLVLGTQYV